MAEGVGVGSCVASGVGVCVGCTVGVAVACKMIGAWDGAGIAWSSILPYTEVNASTNKGSINVTANLFVKKILIISQSFNVTTTLLYKTTLALWQILWVCQVIFAEASPYT